MFSLRNTLLLLLIFRSAEISSQNHYIGAGLGVTATPDRDINLAAVILLNVKYSIHYKIIYAKLNYGFNSELEKYYTNLSTFGAYIGIQSPEKYNFTISGGTGITRRIPKNLQPVEKTYYYYTPDQVTRSFNLGMNYKINKSYSVFFDGFFTTPGYSLWYVYNINDFKSAKDFGGSYLEFRFVIGCAYKFDFIKKEKEKKEN